MIVNRTHQCTRICSSDLYVIDKYLNSFQGGDFCFIFIKKGFFLKMWNLPLNVEYVNCKCIGISFQFKPCVSFLCRMQRMHV